MIDELKALLKRHRAKAVITCDSTCMCWAVENLILHTESQPPAADAGEADPRIIWANWTKRVCSDEEGPYDWREAEIIKTDESSAMRHYVRFLCDDSEYWMRADEVRTEEPRP